MTRPAPINWLRAHERTSDVLLAVFATSAAVVLHLLDLAPPDEFRSPEWWTTFLVVASVLPIAWRRSFPIRSGLFVVAAQIITAFLDIDGTGFLGVLIAIYSIGAHSIGPRRTRAVTAIACSLTVLFVLGLAYSELDVGNFLSSTVVLITAFVLGDNLRRRREKALSLVERAERAEREHALIAEQQITAERTRIARELHDVVAHSVSVMVIQAAAARRNLRDAPDVAETALGNIEATGRQTMTELRGILGVLRSATPEPTLAPQPTMQDLVDLIEASTDLPIRLETAGRFDGLAPSVALTAYRVVQESITNIRRHAGVVTHVDIDVAHVDDALTIRIVDDGRGAASHRARPAPIGDATESSGPTNGRATDATDRERSISQTGTPAGGQYVGESDGRALADSTATSTATSGFGVIGMRERVEAVGGSARVGPRRGGGWQVDAMIPARVGQDSARTSPAALATSRVAS